MALQDGARYALDGLMLGAGGGGAAAREGALALAELLGSRKGRLALRWGRGTQGMMGVVAEPLHCSNKLYAVVGQTTAANVKGCL